jgi:hypothetical protein
MKVETEPVQHCAERDCYRFAPGELESLFGRQWTVQLFAHHERWRSAVFLLTRHAADLIRPTRGEESVT